MNQLVVLLNERDHLTEEETAFIEIVFGCGEELVPREVQVAELAVVLESGKEVPESYVTNLAAGKVQLLEVS